MLKLNASYSKKIPTEVQFSSKSYHASIEVELPDGLGQEQLKGKIADTFALVRDAVESELNGGVKAQPGPEERPQSAAPVPRKAVSTPASNRQLSYLVKLARETGTDLKRIVNDAGFANTGDLDKATCSRLIDSLSSRAA